MTHELQYEQPAAIIDPPRKVSVIRDSGLEEYRAWGWVKTSARFIEHIRKLRGSKLATWHVIALSINERGECALSAPSVAELTGYSVSETRAAIAELDEMGYLSVTRRDGKRSIYKPEFAARSANSPSSEPKLDPSRNSTPPVGTAKRAADPSSLAREKSVPTYKELKEFNVNERIEILKRLYTQNIGAIVPIMFDLLRSAAITYPDDSWYEPAFEIAVKNNGRNWAYVSKILENWQKHGRDWSPVSEREYSAGGKTNKRAEEIIEASVILQKIMNGEA
jgi:DnaD/phage-associated family protein